MSQPDFSIEARIPTEAELRKGSVPTWSDLTLDIMHDDDGGMSKGGQRVHLTRGAGELVCETIREVLHPWAGKSIIEHIWDEVDAYMDALMDGTAATAEAKGTALGLAVALAIMYNPLDPNVDAVREQAVERWELRHADDDDRALDEQDLEDDDADDDIPFR